MEIGSMPACGRWLWPVQVHGLTGGKLMRYVLNITPNWRSDWGEAPYFFDRVDHIKEGYLPTFNALNLFRSDEYNKLKRFDFFLRTDNLMGCDCLSSYRSAACSRLK